MAVLVEKLKDYLLETFEQYEELVVISGYASPQIVDTFAEGGKPVTFYYGMYGFEGITERKLNKFKTSHTTYPNLSIYLVHSQRVHTKCYLFFKDKEIKHALVGSANFSDEGLSGKRNSEMLVELNAEELAVGSEYLTQLNNYLCEIRGIAFECTDPMAIPRPKAKIKPSMFKKGKKAVFPLTGNPYTAIMPLYSITKEGEKVVNPKSGINWGLQGGNTKKKSREYAEAYIPVHAQHIDSYPILFLPFPEIRTTTEGKKDRKGDPVTVVWDDGETMEMVFSGGGVERPTEGKRKRGDPFREYPKQFTSNDGGGEKLGKYLRERMMKAGVEVGKEELITLKHFEKYGRDYITLTYVAPGEYEADFSNT